MASQNWSFLNGSGSTRAATTANTERAEWKIQTDRRNKSKFLPGTNPQVSGFWIFLLLIGEANLNCSHFTGEHELFFRWYESVRNTSVTFILYLQSVFCVHLYACANTCGFPDTSVIWIYGLLAWLLSVRPLFLCPAIKGGKLPKHFAFSAFTPKLCRSRYW